MTDRRSLKAFLCGTIALLCSACSGSSSKCPACGAGLVCNEPTGMCVPTSSSCTATSCGSNATCGSDGQCRCSLGWSDCNGDAGQAGGDGCECSKACSGATCGAQSCSPTTPRSCGQSTSYCFNAVCSPCPSGFNCDGINDCESASPCGGCDAKIINSCGDKSQLCSGGKCTACPSGSYNCDGIDTCESASACSCDAKIINSCGGKSQFCSGGKCTACPSGSYNCDGIDTCESASACASTGCEKQCTDFSEQLCVTDPVQQRCMECLDDTHCQRNPRSYGPKCDTSNLAGTGSNFCVCASAAECATSTVGKLCKAVAGTNPKLTQCICDTGSDCPATHPICEGSVFKICKKRCTGPTDCVRNGVQGFCDTATGTCSYPDI